MSDNTPDNREDLDKAEDLASPNNSAPTLDAFALGHEIFDDERFVHEARRIRDSVPEFAKYFAVENVDVSAIERGRLATSLVRQSLPSQKKNNMITAYLRLVAKWVARHEVILPLEYLYYDTGSGTHFERPGMIVIRSNLLEKRKVGWILFPNMDRGARNSLNQQYLEKEARLRGAKVAYCSLSDEQNSDTAMMKTFRNMQGSMNALQAELLASTTLLGRVSTVERGNVPGGKPPFGCAVDRDPKTGFRILRLIGWRPRPGNTLPVPIKGMQSLSEIASYFEEHTEGYILCLIWYMSVREGYTARAIARYLNEHSYRTRTGLGEWQTSVIAGILRNTVYKGLGIYNDQHFVMNPDRPPPEITMAERRTIRRDKTDGESRRYITPRLVSDEVWQEAQDNLQRAIMWKRGMAPKYLEPLRGFIICPVCKGSMRYDRKAVPGKPLREYWRCISHTKMREPGASSPCDFACNLDASVVRQSIMFQLRQMQMHPEWVQTIAEKAIRSVDDGGSGEQMIKEYQASVDKHRETLRRLNRAYFVSQTIQEDEYEIMRSQAEQVLQDDESVLQTLKDAQANRDRIMYELDTLLADLKMHRELDMGDPEVMIRTMRMFSMRYEPEPNRSGRGALVLFHPAAQRSPLGPPIIHHYAPGGVGQDKDTESVRIMKGSSIP
jgi:hypothetical protein